MGLIGVNDKDAFKMQRVAARETEEERGLGAGSRDKPSTHTHAQSDGLSVN